MSRFNIPGLLGAIGNLPSVINRGLLGPLPVNPALGLDPSQVQQSQDAALNDMAFGMLAQPTRNAGMNLAYARNQARENFSGRIVDLLREDELLRRRKAQDSMDSARSNFITKLGDDPAAQIAQAAPNEFFGAAAQAQFTPGSDGRTDDVKEYEKAVAQGFKGSFIDYMVMMKNAGATRVSQNMGLPTTEKGSAAAVKEVSDAATKGQGAAALMSSANTVRALLDNGAITGFGAAWRLDAARLGKALGVAKGQSGKIANTEGLRSELAWIAINARQQMQGQGQISDYESKMIEQAAGRDPNMTEEGILTVLDVADRAGRANIASARTKVDVLIAADPNLAPLKGTFDIKEPNPYQKNVMDESSGQSITVKMGLDGNYYWTDPKTGERFRWEE